MWWINKELQKENAELKDLLNDERKLCGLWEKRAKDLERSVEHQFGVKVRQDITKVECVFSKTEMAILLAAMLVLITRKETSIDDIEMYLKLKTKIENNIIIMEETDDEL